MTLGTRMDKEIRKTSNERSMKSVKVNREDKGFHPAVKDKLANIHKLATLLTFPAFFSL